MSEPPVGAVVFIRATSESYVRAPEGWLRCDQTEEAPPVPWVELICLEPCQVCGKPHPLGFTEMRLK